MKIYILPVKKKFQPGRQPFLYPKYNDDFGVEQDFFEYLQQNPKLITNDSKNADWHYFPIFWTRYHLNRNYDPVGLQRLQDEVNQVILNDEITFTVCQFDDGPIVDIGASLQCLSSRKNASVTGSMDIPLLASPIQNIPKDQGKIEYLASFQGQFKNHEIRYELNELLSDRKDIFYGDGDKGIKFFTGKLLQSYIGLCPRGYGGSSFRLYEVMQLSRVPLIISDADPRPFKKAINWDKISFYIDEASKINDALKYASKCDLLEMGRKAREIWGLLRYKKWCKYVIEELRL